jgi:hypothetical protein
MEDIRAVPLSLDPQGSEMVRSSSLQPSSPVAGRSAASSREAAASQSGVGNTGMPTLRQLLSTCCRQTHVFISGFGKHSPVHLLPLLYAAHFEVESKSVGSYEQLLPRQFFSHLLNKI